MNPSSLIFLLFVQLASCSGSRAGSPLSQKRLKYDLSAIGTGQEPADDLASAKGINELFSAEDKPSLSFFRSLSPRSSSPSSRSSSFSSQTSEQSGVFTRFTNSFRGKSSKSTSNDADGPRSASTSIKPDFLNYFLDFNAVGEIVWASFEPTWNSVNLTNDQKSMIQQYADDCEHHDIEFISKVYKTLMFLEKSSYPINHFILNLAVFMVNSYDGKGPNAAKLLLDSRFPFMSDHRWQHDKILTKLQPYMKDSRHWKVLLQDPYFNNHIQSLFLDMLHKQSHLHPMMMIYMQVFHGSNTANMFLERYALFLKTLIQVAVSDRHFEGPINVNHLTSVMIFANDELSDAIDAAF